MHYSTLIYYYYYYYCYCRLRILLNILLLLYRGLYNMLEIMFIFRLNRQPTLNTAAIIIALTRQNHYQQVLISTIYYYDTVETVAQPGGGAVLGVETPKSYILCKCNIIINYSCYLLEYGSHSYKIVCSLQGLQTLFITESENQK